jgi:hypothetical protein
MKYCIVLLMLIVPLLAVGQLESNISMPDTSSKPKAMDLPKRKAAKEDLPKRKDNTTVIQPDATLKNLLGEQPTELIANAQIVRAYEVETFLSDNAEDEILEGFKVLQTEELSKIQADRIKQIVLSEKTYFLTEDKKQCLFLPKLGLQFIHNGDTANVLVSFKCDFARFCYGSATTLNSDYGHEDFMAFFRDVFPIDMASTLSAQPITLVHHQMATNLEKPIYYTVELGDGWIIVAQKATNTLKEKVTVDDLCRWNNIPVDQVRANQYFLMKGKTIIVGFIAMDN